MQKDKTPLWDCRKTERKFKREQFNSVCLIYVKRAADRPCCWNAAYVCRFSPAPWQERRIGMSCVIYGLGKVISSNKLSPENWDGEAGNPIVTEQIIDLSGAVTAAFLFSISACYPFPSSIYSRHMNYN